MARTVRNHKLETRAARATLAGRGKPYFRSLEEGLHLGYRKPAAGPGKWVARHYVGDQGYVVETIGAADDLSDADGIVILNYRQAQALARERMVKRAHAAAGKTSPLTVRDVVDGYLEFLENSRKSAASARSRARNFIFPALGDIEADKLSTEKLEGWLADMSKSAARVRTKPGKEQRHRKLGTDEESIRARRSSANRTLTVLKGALNRAWRAGKVASDAAWRRVEPFQGVDSARVRYLTIAEAKRFINGCDPDFRRLAEAALQTGARYGELIRLKVGDFNPDAGTLTIGRAKGKKARLACCRFDGRRVKLIRPSFRTQRG